VTDVDGSDELNSVSCPASGLCVAVDNGGNVVTSTNPTGWASAWTVTDVDGSNLLFGVSCPSIGLCVAVDWSGNVVTSTNPTGGASAWTAADDVSGGTNSLSGVSCPSIGLCVAVDNAGNVVTSTNPTGGTAAWTVTHVDGSNYLSGVSCPSSGLCIAVDRSGDVVTSTDPTAATPAWTVTHVDGYNRLNGVSCPSSGLCVAVDGSGNVVTSNDPTGGASAWTVTHVDGFNGLNGVSCPSSGLCVAVDGYGNVVTSTNPTGGAAAWTVTDVDGTTGLSGVSCPSIGLCVAVDMSGNVITSTNPTGGAPAWTVTHVDVYMLLGVSCASSGLCVAVDGNGDVVASTDPTGGATAWTVTHVDGTNYPDGVSCPSSGLCVAVDDEGDVVTGVPPAPTVTTGAASAVLWSTATLNGTVNPNGYATTYQFQYGTSTSYGMTTTSTSAGSGTSAVAAVADLTGLSPDTTYDFQLVATNLNGTSYGSNGTFTTPGAITTAVSTLQYLLANSDGSTWHVMDATNLSLTITPTSDEDVLLSANADLWTFSAGYNQDIGILVTPSGGSPVLAAWKESGGFAGTFSPNAAFVETVYPMSGGTTYAVQIVWKTNKAAIGATIAAGAGPIGSAYSPTRLTADVLPDGYATAVRTQQYTLTSSNGSNWVPIDATNLTTTLSPTSSEDAVISGNADLWTATAGVNQDIGIFVSEDGGTATLVAWKESGGFAGTFSPNAAYVQTVYPVNPGHTYVFTLEWKTNKAAPGSTIYAGAGPISGAFSPTRLTAYEVATGSVETAVSTQQYSLANSNGSTWAAMDSTNLTASLTPGATENVLVSGNADLWTAAAGYNQDIGIFVSEDGTTPTLVAWKESGGFAGTFSPNAAYVQVVYTVNPGHTYVFSLEWKTNKAASGATIYAGAGPIGSAYSPTRLTVVP
jgi:hypothetical protein